MLTSKTLTILRKELVLNKTKSKPYNHQNVCLVFMLMSNFLCLRIETSIKKS